MARTREQAHNYYLKHKEKQEERRKLKRKNNWPATLKYNRDYYERTKVKQIEQARGRRVVSKLKALGHYSGGTPICLCCKETHIQFLTIDHINGGGYKHRKEIRTGNMYTWLIAREFPDGYRVLCMNCNFSLGKYNHCPHGNLPPKKGMVL